MYNPTNPSNKQQYTPMPRPNFSAYDIANYICLTCNDLHQYNRAIAFDTATISSDPL
jgi:hypothetical protein